ncbi:ATP-dependent DNA helicase CHL1-like [Malus domestica]|uniref:ATP-dependent DNA helicase CHL1-like n=1 Tax=Malus domestica TaxID=3750 RepID=UPI0007ECB33B
MAVVVLSQDNEPYAYGNPSVNKVLDRFLGEGTSSKRHDDDDDDDDDDDSDDDCDDDGDEDLERTKEREKVEEIKRLLPAPDKNWGLEELLNYKAFMQRLKAKVDSKIYDMKRRETNNYYGCSLNCWFY